MTNVPTLPTITTSTTIDDILAWHPSALGICNAFGLDTCCGGSVTLHDAATEAGTDPHVLLAVFRTNAHESAPEGGGGVS